LVELKRGYEVGLRGALRTPIAVIAAQGRRVIPDDAARALAAQLKRLPDDHGVLWIVTAGRYLKESCRLSEGGGIRSLAAAGS
jgi:hypothetical protein